MTREDELLDELDQEPCEDAVSRAEVIKIAKEMYLEVANMDLDVKTISDCISYTSSKCREVLERKLQALSSVTPQDPNWIKCSEHLPNFDVDVLATTKEYGDVVKVTRWRTILKDCGWEWVLVDDTEGNVYNSDEIIAWMPLPEPYKAESEDKE